MEITALLLLDPGVSRTFQCPAKLNIYTSSKAIFMALIKCRKVFNPRQEFP